MTVYGDLDSALAIVAAATFYEDKAITPHPDGGWEVNNTSAYLSDDWEWTYANGVVGRDSASETSRLQAAYEYYGCAEHIRYNMAESVAVLEARTHKVEFAYAVVTNMDADHIDDDGDIDYAGWILVANHYAL